nr:hypothetical protein [Escherichia coli]
MVVWYVLLLSVTVSVCPACAVVVPLMVIPAPASLTLRVSSLAMVLIVISGAVASTLYARSAWALLPLILLTLACTYYMYIVFYSNVFQSYIFQRLLYFLLT